MTTDSTLPSSPREPPDASGAAQPAGLPSPAQPATGKAHSFTARRRRSISATEGQQLRGALDAIEQPLEAQPPSLEERAKMKPRRSRKLTNLFKKDKTEVASSEVASKESPRTSRGEKSVTFSSAVTPEAQLSDALKKLPSLEAERSSLDAKEAQVRKLQRKLLEDLSKSEIKAIQKNIEDLNGEIEGHQACISKLETRIGTVVYEGIAAMLETPEGLQKAKVLLDTVGFETKSQAIVAQAILSLDTDKVARLLHLLMTEEIKTKMAAEETPFRADSLTTKLMVGFHEKLLPDTLGRGINDFLTTAMDPSRLIDPKVQAKIDEFCMAFLKSVEDNIRHENPQKLGQFYDHLIRTFGEQSPKVIDLMANVLVNRVIFPRFRTPRAMTYTGSQTEVAAVVAKTMMASAAVDFTKAEPLSANPMGQAVVNLVLTTRRCAT